MNKENIAAISRAALDHCPGLLEELLPGGRIRGKEYICANLSGGHGSSCSVNFDSGEWADFAAGDRGGDLVSLVAAIEGVKQFDAARRLAERIGYSLPAEPKKPAPKRIKQDVVINMPVPADAPQAPLAWHNPVAVWEYRDQEGRLLGYVRRFNKTETDSQGKPKKDFLPLVHTSNGWKAAGFPAPLPFFRLQILPELPPDALMLIVEGEACAESLASILEPNMGVLSIHGGSGRVKDMDFSPLRGRQLLYWPDNDAAGAKGALAFAESAKPIAAEISILNPPLEAPAKWDAADAVREGWDRERLLDLLNKNRTHPERFAEIAQTRWLTPKEDPQPPAYHAIDVFDFMSLQIPERENLIAPILQTQGIAMLHADRGVGKTYTALSTAYMVASGGSLFGRWNAPRPARVLYLDGEMPARAMQDRLRAISTGADSDITSKGLLSIVTPDLQDAPMPNLATPEGQQAVEPFIANHEFVIIDNLATLASYGRANEEESWRPMQEWLLKLRRQGKTSLVIHHEGKSGTQRGTIAKEDTMDTVIRLKRPKDYKSEEGARFEVYYTKGRHITGEDAKPFEACLTTGPAGNLIWTTRTLENVELEQYRELRDAGYTIRDAAEEMGITKGKAEWLEKKLKQS